MGGYGTVDDLFCYGEFGMNIWGITGAAVLGLAASIVELAIKVVVIVWVLRELGVAI